MARFVLLGIAFGILAIAGGNLLARALLPLFAAEVHWLDDALRIDRLALAEEAGESVIVLEVGLAHAVTLNGRTFQPDPRGKATSSTPAGNLFVPTALFLAVVCAIPGGGWRRRVLLGVPALLLVWAVGVPLILWGNLYGLLLQAAAPTQHSTLVEWADFASGGGGITVAITVALSVALLSRSPGVSGQQHSQDGGQQDASPQG